MKNLLLAILILLASYADGQVTSMQEYCNTQYLSTTAFFYDKDGNISMIIETDATGDTVKQQFFESGMIVRETIYERQITYKKMGSTIYGRVNNSVRAKYRASASGTVAMIYSYGSTGKLNAYAYLYWYSGKNLDRKYGVTENGRVWTYYHYCDFSNPLYEINKKFRRGYEASVHYCSEKRIGDNVYTYQVIASENNYPTRVDCFCQGMYYKTIIYTY